jgi:predicted transcriptional regulator
MDDVPPNPADEALKPGQSVRFVFPVDPEDEPEFRPSALALPDNPSSQRNGAITLPHEIHQARVSIVAGFVLQGYTRNRIAAALGITRNAVDWCIRTARNRGELAKGILDAAKTIDEEAVPLAVEGLLGHLRKGDKDMITKTLEGRGLLKHHTSKEDTTRAASAPMAFQFNFVTKDGVALPQKPEIPTLDGAVIGVERDE